MLLRLTLKLEAWLCRYATLHAIYNLGRVSWTSGVCFWSVSARYGFGRNVIYKEHALLNQAASNSLMARLEAQKAMCDSSERELHKKF
ncbi:hypothetical protein Tco_0808418 [Tanacetum coccineum]